MSVFEKFHVRVVIKTTQLVIGSSRRYIICATIFTLLLNSYDTHVFQDISHLSFYLNYCQLLPRSKS
jgi:hypothetical protein